VATSKDRGQKAKGKGRDQADTSQAEGHAPASIEALYQLPLSEFTPARNALATRLRKGGNAAQADEVKSLVKPSIPAWAVNQVYWKHRGAFDTLLTAGDGLRNAQSSTLAGKSGDVRGALDDVREALSALSRLAAEQLETAGHNPSPGVMRAITATLEALSAYGSGSNAPPAGRLVDEVDPPGFETLAALVPNASGSSGSEAPSRVLRFRSETPAAKPSRRHLSGEEAAERDKKEREAKLTAAKAAVQDATQNLRDARSTAQDAQAALKKAAADAKDTEKAMIDAEAILEKAAKDAHTARQLARRLAVEAEVAAQAVEDAERALTRAKADVTELT
jgi:hypothetical protein